MNEYNHSEIVREIAETIARLLYKKDTSDHTFKAKVTGSAGPKKYKILYSGNTYTASSSASYSEGDLVWVCAPCGTWDNLFIVTKS